MPYIDIDIPTKDTRIIAFSDDEKNEVIATGKNYDDVTKKAEKAGCKHPCLMTIPMQNKIHFHS